MWHPKEGTILILKITQKEQTLNFHILIKLFSS